MMETIGDEGGATTPEGRSFSGGGGEEPSRRHSFAETAVIEVEPKRQSIDLVSIFPTPNTIVITDPIYRLPCITKSEEILHALVPSSDWFKLNVLPVDSTMHHHPSILALLHEDGISRPSYTCLFLTSAPVVCS